MHCTHNLISPSMVMMMIVMTINKCDICVTFELDSIQLSWLCIKKTIWFNCIFLFFWVVLYHIFNYIFCEFWLAFKDSYRWIGVPLSSHIMVTNTIIIQCSQTKMKKEKAEMPSKFLSTGSVAKCYFDSIFPSSACKKLLREATSSLES